MVLCSSLFFFYNITNVYSSLLYFVKLFKHLLFINKVRQKSIMYYYLFKMQCGNPWFFGQKIVSRINVIPLKYFVKGLMKKETHK